MTDTLLKGITVLDRRMALECVDDYVVNHMAGRNPGKRNSVAYGREFCGVMIVYHTPAGVVVAAYNSPPGEQK